MMLPPIPMFTSLHDSFAKLLRLLVGDTARFWTFGWRRFVFDLYKVFLLSAVSLRTLQLQADLHKCNTEDVNWPYNVLL